MWRHVANGSWAELIFVFALCCPSGARKAFLVDLLDGMIEHHDENRHNVMISLLGQFKGEDHSSQYLMPRVAVTESGIQVKTWMGQLLAVH